MNLEKEILNIEDTPLTIDFLKKYKYPIKVNYIIYSSIKKYNTIDELFGKNQGLIILIDKGQSVGHFVCLLKKQKNIEFFGPYSFTLSKILKILNINDYSLIKLFNKSNYRIYYNKYKYEDINNPKIETCGRHCIIRLIKFSLNNNEYYKWLKYKNLKPDEITSLLTFL